jgi:hypothetical protein
VVRRGRGRLMQPLLTSCQQLLVFHLFSEKWISACSFELNYPRRTLFAPLGKELKSTIDPCRDRCK